MSEVNPNSNVVFRVGDASGSVDVETLWAQDLGNDRYKLDNSPYSFGQTIFGRPDLASISIRPNPTCRRASLNANVRRHDEIVRVKTRKTAMILRPSFIRSTQATSETTHTYPQSIEPMGPVRALGKEAGLQRIGVNVQRLAPGSRSSWPHAEECEEEFVYVLAGEVDAWIDGTLYRMHPGDLAAFPAGTGISHCFINNTDSDVELLVGGEAAKQENRIYYPLNPSRRSDLAPSDWWDDVPKHEIGPHDGLPDKGRNQPE